MSAPGYQLPRDPTAVIGPRIGAWIVDAVLYTLLCLMIAPTPLSPLAEYHDVPEGIGLDACDILRDNDEAAGCVVLDDKVYFTESSDLPLQIGAWVLFVGLIFVVMQGMTGLTPGKLLFGLRTVGEDGQAPGIGRALVRTVLWIVDGQPCGIPLVGFICGVTSTGHRRVGDMAAKTYVIRKADAGRPVVVPGLSPGYPGAGVGYGQPGYGPPTTYPPAPGGYPSEPGAPSGAPWGAAPPSPGPWGAPEPGTPGGPLAGTAPTDPRPAPPFSQPEPAAERPAPPVAPTAPTAPSSETSTEARAEPEVVAVPTESPSTTTTAEAAPPAADITPAADATDPDAGDEEPEAAAASDTDEAKSDIQTEVVAVPAAESPAPATPAVEVGPSSPPPEGTRPEYNPQWDAARGTYIQWDANRSRWLQWDDTAKEWKPI